MMRHAGVVHIMASRIDFRVSSIPAQTNRAKLNQFTNKYADHSTPPTSTAKNSNHSAHFNSFIMIQITSTAAKVPTRTTSHCG
jgi:hypothetical protein